MTKTLRIIVTSAILVLALTFPSVAADYPTKAITIINPNAPGGQFDVLGRAFAVSAEKLSGKPVVVVNKPGAGNLVGALAGAQAAPDGHTLTMIATGLTNGIEWERANGRTPPVTQNSEASTREAGRTSRPSSRYTSATNRSKISGSYVGVAFQSSIERARVTASALGVI